MIKKYTVDEFIDITKLPENKFKFINYLECLMDKKGNIILANPSHNETLIQLAKEDGFNIDPYDAIHDPEVYMHEYNVIMIWYDFADIYSIFTDEQIEGLTKLKDNGLLSNTFHILNINNIVNVEEKIKYWKSIVE